MVALPRLGVGPHQIQIAYSGDAVTGPVVSAPFEIRVVPDSTRITLTTAPQPSTQGQAVTLAARIDVANEAGSTGSGVPPLSGQVTFFEGATVLGTIPVVATTSAPFLATASLTTAGLGSGLQTITARYSGDVDRDGAISNTVSQVVYAAATAPQVVSVVRYGYHQAPTRVVIGFNAPLDPVTAVSLANYQITNSRGQTIRVQNATYDAFALTVSLAFRSRLDLHRTYILQILGSRPGGVQGASGGLLDGLGAGRPGSDDQIILTAANLVVPRRSAAGARAALRLAARGRKTSLH